MKKIGLTLFLLCATMIATNSVKGQNENTQTKTKNSHFGFGASTSLFDGTTIFNGFTAKTLYYSDASRSSSLDLHSTTAFSLYLEYQYDLSDDFTLATELKYNHRDLDFNYCFYAGTTMKSINKCNVDLNNLQIPFIMKCKIFNSRNLDLWTNVGFGADINLGCSKHNIDNKVVNTNGTIAHYDFHLEVLKDVVPFFYCGVSMDHKFKGNKKLETKLSYTINTKNNYQYISTDIKSEKFIQNNFEIGFAYFL